MGRAEPPLIHFVTGNLRKFAEAEAILRNVARLRRHVIEVPEIQGSLEEIAREKWRNAAATMKGPVLTEDSALEFRALNGLPGPYIKEFYSALGNDGLCQLLAAFKDKSASAVFTYAFSSGPGVEPVLFQGRVDGQIVTPRGTNGFAFDPIFEVQGKHTERWMLKQRHVKLAANMPVIY
ncbi:non-canonical purine NTP pyrophosphatase [Aspergillus fischeri NRRL 181]|uniref:Ham1 family protein n=1 Tax=Neosartorya fischeri (strain ATCC 1020 / DSM 3700 / CBS 544.65 / FGSC A1164 / JCM 1740 / NRRL 181 / WB 181) TaxID=331117 RepID=A1DA96_NEOFI|nr:Ham1 family protein [Aspergillus fischeri NRRL 181]EAW19786.1 Ham1 family protein [Aspergillus fischeri NRRL 181]